MKAQFVLQQNNRRRPINTNTAHSLKLFTGLFLKSRNLTVLHKSSGYWLGHHPGRFLSYTAVKNL